MKRIISTILAIVMVLGTCVVPFASVADTTPLISKQISTDNKVKVTVEGYAQENSRVAIEVLKPGMTAEAGSSAFEYIDEATTSGTGAYKFVFKMDNAIGGTYSVNVYRQGTGSIYTTQFAYIPAPIIIDDFNKLKEKVDPATPTTTPTPAQIRGEFNSYKAALGLDSELEGMMNDQQIVDSLEIAFESATTPQQLGTLQFVFNQNIALTGVNTFSASNIVRLFEADGGISSQRYFGLSEGIALALNANAARYSRYTAMTAQQKLQVANLVIANMPLVSASEREYTSVAQVFNAFNDSVYLTELKTSPWTGISTVIVNNSDKVDPAIYAKYTAITDNAKKMIRDQYIVSHQDSIVDIAFANKGIDDGVNAANGGISPVRTSGPGPVGGGGTSVTIDYSTPIPATVTPAATFDDLDTVPWAVESINTLASQGVLSGKEAGKFSPNDKITRQEFAKMAVLAFGLSDANAVADFTDVPKDSWAYPYVASASTAGVIQGLGDGTFGASLNITRQDVATICFRAGVKKDAAFTKTADAALNFTDKDSISDYAAKAVSILASVGAINGMGDGQFAPNETCTRAQAAKIIYEVSKLMK